jgi:hypothetical protein
MGPQVLTKIGLGVTSLPLVGNVGSYTPLSKKQGPSQIHSLSTYPNYIPSLPQVSDTLAISESMIIYTYSYLLHTYLYSRIRALLPWI